AASSSLLSQLDGGAGGTSRALKVPQTTTHELQEQLMTDLSIDVLDSVTGGATSNRVLVSRDQAAAGALALKCGAIDADADRSRGVWRKANRGAADLCFGQLRDASVQAVERQR